MPKSCCQSKRVALVNNISNKITYFKYKKSIPVNIKGNVTGTIYSFGFEGDIQKVDMRDRDSLKKLWYLEEITE